MWGIVPAAGRGTRIQPLAFSKELLPVGTRVENGAERPRAISEYLLDRMITAGADKVCFVIAPGKTDILTYYGSDYRSASLAYVVQPAPAGLCDAVFRASSLIGADEPVIIGLPDTLWFPEDALDGLPDDRFSCLLFPADHPECFDAVVHDAAGRVSSIEVKSEHASTNWIWGAMKMPGRVLHGLRRLWLAREQCDEYLGTLINAYIAEGGEVWAARAGTRYIDVGTLEGYRAAVAAAASTSAAPKPLEVPVAGGPRGAISAAG